MRKRRSWVTGGFVAVSAAAALWALGGVADAQEPTVIQGQNSSRNDTAVSGDAVAVNRAGPVLAGPTARDGGQAQQMGDNTAVVRQQAEAESGPAVAGSQVVGAVDGGATVQLQNASRNAVARSGDAVAVNRAGPVRAGPVAAGRRAQAQQIGDNTVVVDQEAEAESGAAVAGSQVVGLVDAFEWDGEAVVQLQNSSVRARAVSGDVLAVNRTRAVVAGPLARGGRSQQVGDNEVVIDQLALAQSGPAVAGSQIVGVVGAFDFDERLRRLVAVDRDMRGAFFRSSEPGRSPPMHRARVRAAGRHRLERLPATGGDLAGLWAIALLAMLGGAGLRRWSVVAQR